jgi:hypothetical protein
MFDDLRGAVSTIRQHLAGADPDRVTTGQAAEAVAVFAELSRLSSAGLTVYAPRGAESTDWVEAGHHSPASWLAETCGTGLGEAISTLKTGAGLRALPAASQALRSGTLSSPQAKEIVAAAGREPRSERDLVEAAATGSLKSLKNRCRKIRPLDTGAEAELARHEAIRASRYFSHFSDGDGAFCFAGRTTAEHGARMLAAVGARADELFEEARRADRFESPRAYALDALVDLVTTSGTGIRKKCKEPATIVIHVDAAALRRGHARSGERCDVAGVGPVPVATVERELPGAFVKVLVEKGVDITTVCHVGRTIPAHVFSALEARYETCVVPGCDVANGLEAHHVVPFAKGSPTSLANLVLVCGHHHYLITHKGYELGGTEGHRHLVIPDGYDRNGMPTRAGPTRFFDSDGDDDPEDRLALFDGL